MKKTKFSFKLLAISLIVLLGLGLRLWGVYPGYSQTHPDEPQTYSRALLVVLGKQSELGYYGYPALVSLIHAFLYATVFIPFGIIKALISNPSTVDLLFSNLEKFLYSFVFGPAEINVMYWGRIVNAFMGAATVVLVYKVAKKYFNEVCALVASLFVAVNYRHVLSSHFALVDVANGLFFLLTYLATHKLLTQPKAKNYILVGLASALSLSVKLSPFMLIPPAIAHLFSNKKWTVKSFWLKPLLFGVVFVFAVLVINLFHLSHLPELMKDWETLNKRYVSGIFEFLPYPYVYLFNFGIKPVTTLLCLLGIVWGSIRKPKETIILMVPVMLFFFTLTFYSIGGVYIRNFIAVIPVLLIFAGFGFSFLWQRAKSIVFKILLTLLIVAAVAPHFKDSIIVSQNYSIVWNMDRIKTALASGYEGKTIAAQQWIGMKVLPGNVKHLISTQNTLFSLRALQNKGVDYALIDTESAEGNMTWWMTFRGTDAFSSAPKDLLYSTFTGSGLKELLSYRVVDVVKPAIVPEMNFYLVKIPKRITNFIGTTVWKDDFEKDVNWKIKGSLGKQTPNTGIVQEIGCVQSKCVRLGTIAKDNSTWKYLSSNGSPRFFRFTSEPKEIRPNTTYKVTVRVSSKTEIPAEQPEGFMKVELYKTLTDAKSDKPGDEIFITEKYWGNKAKLLDLYFFAHPDFKYMTVSFQTDLNPVTNIYFDNLVVESSNKDYDILGLQKDFPEQQLFVTNLY